MSKLNQVKIPVDIQTNNWKLARERDGLTKQSAEVMWVEFNEDGTFKKKTPTSCTWSFINYVSV